jgi:prolyl 4-hydroxylase
MTIAHAKVLLGDARNRSSYQQAFELLRIACDQFDAESAYLLSVLYAAGGESGPDWERALDYLLLAADRGWAPAQSQLKLLAAAGGDDADSRWKVYRSNVDLARWRAPSSKLVIAQRPRLRAIKQFVDAAICCWLIQSAAPRLARARTYDLSDGTSTVESSRTNSEAEFGLLHVDLIHLLVRERIAAAVGLPVEVMELSRVLHYRPGQQFQPHYDFLNPAEPGLQQELADQGQRLVTFLIYLNDDYSAGETEFPLIGLRHRGATGDALYFANVGMDGVPEPLSLHSGNTPAAGEKWIFSQWIRSRPPT